MINFSRMLSASIFAVGVSFAQMGPPEPKVYDTALPPVVQAPKKSVVSEFHRLSLELKKNAQINDIFWVVNRTTSESDKIQCLNKLSRYHLQYIFRNCKFVKVIESFSECGDQEELDDVCCYVKSDLLNPQEKGPSVFIGPPEE